MLTLKFFASRRHRDPVVPVLVKTIQRWTPLNRFALLYFGKITTQTKRLGKYFLLTDFIFIFVCFCNTGFYD